MKTKNDFETIKKRVLIDVENPRKNVVPVRIQLEGCVRRNWITESQMNELLQIYINAGINV